MTFKPGDTVYSFRHGVVTLVEGDPLSDFPIGIETSVGIERYTARGRYLLTDKHPSIITIEKAEMELYACKRKLKFKRRVKYRDTRDNSVHISTREYEGFWDFIESPWEPKHSEFMCFVDEQGNEWVRPEKTFEWVEV